MLGRLLNVLLRLSIAFFLVEVLRNPDDPRFAGKALSVRNLVIVGGLSLLFPAFHFFGKKLPPSGRTYPVWFDNLYLSIFVLDMLGNSLDLYDSYEYFDLLPHFHGSGAMAVVLRSLTPMSPLSAAGLANMIHVALEIQEYYTDLLVGTRNVRGTYDVLNDLAVGLAGTVTYSGVFAFFQRRRARLAESRRRRLVTNA